MEIAKISAKGQTTIPVAIRQAAALQAGDTITFEVDNGKIIIRKVRLPADPYLQEISDTLTEWSSPQDERAWRNL